MQQFIVNLHGLGEPPEEIDFSEQKYWLSESAFYQLLDEVCLLQRDEKTSIDITFDDGNNSDVNIALPALVSRGLRGRFFLCSKRIGKPNYLDRKAIEDLMAAKMIIGSHGMNHVDWRKAADQELELEISDARRRIEDICGCAVTEVAIPFGSYNRKVISKLRKERLSCVFTSDGGMARADAWCKPRNSIDSSWRRGKVADAIRRGRSPFFRLQRDLSAAYKSLR